MNSKHHGSRDPAYRLGLVLAVCWALVGCAASGGVVVGPSPGVIVSPAPQPRQVDIPKGHYPPPGRCRIWVPGVPPGQQTPPGNCEELQHRVPPGAVLVRG
jgi:hypothetical protein